MSLIKDDKIKLLTSLKVLIERDIY